MGFREQTVSNPLEDERRRLLEALRGCTKALRRNVVG